MTKGELQKLIKGLICNKEERTESFCNDYHDLPRLVTGIKDAARVLGVAPSTIARWKKSGGYDDCIFQDERSCGLIRTRCWRRCVQATGRVSMEKLFRIKKQ